MKHSISDQEFLENYIRFAAVHRWRVANACFERLQQADDKSTERAHFALEIFCCYLLLMEDLLMWYGVLKKAQTPATEPLIDLLDQMRLRPNVKDNALTALKEIEDMPVTDLMGLLDFPQTPGAMTSNLSAEDYEIERRHIVRLKEEIANGINTFLHGKTGFWQEGTFVLCLNKIKHGLLVMRRPESTGAPQSVVIFPNGTNSEATLPEVSSNEDDASMTLSEIVKFTVAFVGMLTVVHQNRFECDPAGELPEQLLKAFEDRCALGRKSAN